MMIVVSFSPCSVVGPVEAEGSRLREEGGGHTARREAATGPAVGVRAGATRCGGPARKFVPQRNGSDDGGLLRGGITLCERKKPTHPLGNLHPQSRQ